MKIWTLHNEVLEPIEDAVNNHYDKLDSEVLEDIETALERADTIYKKSLEIEEKDWMEIQEGMENRETELLTTIAETETDLDKLFDKISDGTIDIYETQKEIKEILATIRKGI